MVVDRRLAGRSHPPVAGVVCSRAGRLPLDGHCPERTVDAGNETDIRGVVVFVGFTV